MLLYEYALYTIPGTLSSSYIFGFSPPPIPEGGNAIIFLMVVVVVIVFTSSYRQKLESVVTE